MIIAIDGPAGAGKSTISRRVAQRLGFLYIDTGAMYRALTLKSIEQKINIDDTQGLIRVASVTKIDLVPAEDAGLKVLLDGRDVTREIRQPHITRLVSDIAKIKGVREAILGLQRQLGKSKDSVLDGRDIGTVVFPDADKKFYLDAQFDVRAGRRYKELKESGNEVTPEDIRADLHNRDTIDSTREVAPLKKAPDAICIDTTNMTIEEVINEVLQRI